MQTNPTSSSHGIGSSGKRAETRLQNRSVVLLYKSGLDPAREAYGGGKETRTPDPHAASVMLYQLSYAPKFDVVEMRRFELLTPCLQSRFCPAAPPPICMWYKETFVRSPAPLCASGGYDSRQNSHQRPHARERSPA